MDLVELLTQSGDDIIAEAVDGLARVHLQHYQASTPEQNRERLTRLLALTRQCVADRNLVPMLKHARAVAQERQRDGFDLMEVHTAFNVLEEVIWRRITAEVTPADYPEAFGLVSTVLGAGKQALAVEYVSLVSAKRDVSSLDLSALFKGT